MTDNEITLNLYYQVSHFDYVRSFPVSPSGEVNPRAIELWARLHSAGYVEEMPELANANVGRVVRYRITEKGATHRAELAKYARARTSYIAELFPRTKSVLEENAHFIEEIKRLKEELNAACKPDEKKPDKEIFRGRGFIEISDEELAKVKAESAATPEKQREQWAAMAREHVHRLRGLHTNPMRDAMLFILAYIEERG